MSQPAPGPTERSAIAVEGLEKTYPNGTRAVRGVTFRVRRGEIYGLLGPNGAGKSTIIGVLGTLVKPTRGRAVVDGIDVVRDPASVRRRIGFAMQEAGVDLLATGREFLVLQARLYGISKAEAHRRAADLLALVEISEAGDKRIGSYSGGMKRRIDLAAALIHDPPILFLDEPTEGLDPRSRRTLWDTLTQLQEARGLTVILSTHYMEEADHLCDRIGLLNAGRIVAEDTPERLKATLGGQRIVLDWGDAANGTLERAQEALRRAVANIQVAASGSQLQVETPDAPRVMGPVLRALESYRLSPMNVRIHEPTLDDVYLHYTGETLATEEEREAAGGKGGSRAPDKGGPDGRGTSATKGRGANAPEARR